MVPLSYVAVLTTVLVGELVTTTYALDVSAKVVKVVCAKAPFLTVTVVVPEKRSVDAEIDQMVRVKVLVAGTETLVTALEADELADQYEVHCSQQFPVKDRV
jgi:hypothetical protein